MLTFKVAKGLVFERGLRLPIDGEFETPRLKEIAVRLHELAVEHEKLEHELELLADERNKQAAKNALGSDRTWDELN